MWGHLREGVVRLVRSSALVDSAALVDSEACFGERDSLTARGTVSTKIAPFFGSTYACGSPSSAGFPPAATLPELPHQPRRLDLSSFKKFATHSKQPGASFMATPVCEMDHCIARIVYRFDISTTAAIILGTAPSLSCPRHPRHPRHP